MGARARTTAWKNPNVDIKLLLNMRFGAADAFLTMPVQKPYSWERPFDPDHELPPATSARGSRRPWYDSGTVEQLARSRCPVLPMGDYVYRQTKEVEHSGPVSFVQGRTHKGWVYYIRNEKQFVRPFVQPRDPRTAYQVDHRVRMQMVQMALPRMTRAQRQDWDRFASEFPHLRDNRTRLGAVSGHRALRLYKSASLNRLAMGLPVRVEAPTAKCTVAVTSAEVVAAPEAGQVAFRIFYSGRSQAGLRVLVEMSPGMKSGRRSPREQELTKAAVTDAGSFFPLGENGASYVLTQPRYTIAPGQRFALRVTVLTEEGMRSRSFLRTDVYGVASLGEAQVAGAVDTTRPYGVAATEFAGSGARPSGVSFIYALPTPAEALPSATEVYRRHHALYCPDRAVRPLTAEQLARRLAADQEAEQQFRRQVAATEEQLRQNKLAAAQRWEQMKRDYPELIARGVRRQE